MNKSDKLLRVVYSYFSQRYKIPIRLNFAGGEPFLSKNLLELVKRAKLIGFNVSFISNGSLINKELAINLSDHINMAAFSIDSDSFVTDRLIGRANKKGSTINQEELLSAIDVFKSKNIKVKINTVVNTHNHKINMTKLISKISPFKWKVFKVLPVEQSIGIVSDNDFNSFIERHQDHRGIIFPENNDQMTESYVMIDPLGRFYQNTQAENAGYIYSDPILNVGVDKAFEKNTFNLRKFKSRYILETNINSLKSA